MQLRLFATNSLYGIANAIDYLMSAAIEACGCSWASPNMCCAKYLTRPTFTAFPNCLYACCCLTSGWNDSGKFWSRAHSLGVKKRRLEPMIEVCTIATSAGK